MNPTTPNQLRGTTTAVRGGSWDPWMFCSDLREPLERLLTSAIRSHTGSLAAPLARVNGAGGKRLRPALAMTMGIGCFLPVERQDLIKVAAAVELLHCATLVHDDLIDAAAVRRDVPTVSAQEGLPSAVVGGDALIGCAVLLAGQVSRDAALVLGETLVDLCQGQALEDDIRSTPPPCVDELCYEQLFRVIRLKTGSLLRAACVLGAQAAGADARLVAAAAEFGMQFGITLQLLDDVLDVVSTPSLAGKPVGTDFAAGILTLPTALAMRASPELARMFGAALGPNARDRSLALLRSVDSVSAAVSRAAEHAGAARAALSSVADVSAVIDQIADWPMLYLRSQLQTKVDPTLLPVVGAALPAW
jgi:geranylgeranyl pyrophosphate synthase